MHSSAEDGRGWAGSKYGDEAADSVKAFDKANDARKAADAAAEAKKAADAAEAAKKASDAKQVAEVAEKAKAAEPRQLARGKRAHKEEPVLPGEKAEVPTPSGKRMDRYDPAKGHIREIKPNNPRAVCQGEKQVERYRQEMEKATGRPHTGEVSPYDAKKYE